MYRESPSLSDSVFHHLVVWQCRGNEGKHFLFSLRVSNVLCFGCVQEKSETFQRKEKKIKLQMPYQPSSRQSSPPSPSGPRCPQLKVLRCMVLEKAETQKPTSPVKGRSLHISYKYTLLCLTHILL